jgi:hypothetical protein
MPASAAMVRASSTDCTPNQQPSTLREDALASGATARATSAGSTTALGAWIISTALAPGSCSSTSTTSR